MPPRSENVRLGIIAMRITPSKGHQCLQSAWGEKVFLHKQDLFVRIPRIGVHVLISHRVLWLERCSLYLDDSRLFIEGDMTIGHIDVIERCRQIIRRNDMSIKTEGTETENNPSKTSPLSLFPPVYGKGMRAKRRSSEANLYQPWGQGIVKR